MDTMEQIGRDIWLTGTRPEDLVNYLNSINVSVPSICLEEIQLAYNECQFMLITSNLIDLSERLKK